LQGADWAGLPILTSGTETDPNDTLATATPIPLNSRTLGTLTGASPDFFQITLTQPARLTVRVHAVGFHTRLSLLDQSGRLLIQSAGQSLANPDDLIVQHLAATAAGTTYYLEVEGTGDGAGAYNLTTQFVPSACPTSSARRWMRGAFYTFCAYPPLAASASRSLAGSPGALSENEHGSPKDTINY